MTDIYISLGTFRRLIRKGKYVSPIFESRRHVVTSIGNLTVIATKKQAKRLYDTSYPFESLGYASIASWEKEKKTLDERSVIEIVDDVIGILEGLPGEVLAEVFDLLDKSKEMTRFKE